MSSINFVAHFRGTKRLFLAQIIPIFKKIFFFFEKIEGLKILKLQ